MQHIYIFSVEHKARFQKELPTKAMHANLELTDTDTSLIFVGLFFCD
jgi:hypothetical protein